MFVRMSFPSTITNKHDGNMVEENIRRALLGQQQQERDNSGKVNGASHKTL